MKKLLLLFTVLLYFTAFAQQEIALAFEDNSATLQQTSAVNFGEWITYNNDADIISVEGYTGLNANKELSRQRTLLIVQALVASKMERKFDIKYVADNASDEGIVVIRYKLPESLEGGSIGIKAVEITKLAKDIKKARKNDRLELKNVGFNPGTDKVLNSAEDALDDLVQILKTMPALRIDIQGHICCSRADEQNLSERRAKAIYNYLIKKGIAKERLSYQGFGGRSPVYSLPEITEYERQANRRVEIQITGM